MQMKERERLKRLSEEKEKKFADMVMREVDEWKVEEKMKKEEARRQAYQMKEERDAQRIAQRKVKEAQQSKQQRYEQQLQIQQLKALKATRREEEEKRRIQVGENRMYGSLVIDAPPLCVRSIIDNSDFTSTALSSSRSTAFSQTRPFYNR